MSSLLIFRAPERAAAAAPLPAAEDVVKGQRASEIFTHAEQDPFAAILGRLTNPDPTLRRHAGGEELSYYFRMRRQITALGGIVEQLVDEAYARRPYVVPGDASNEESVAVADQMRRIYDDIPEKHVSLPKSIDNIITCGFAPIEQVWERDEQTGIIAATRLIDRPPMNIAWDAAENPFFLTTADPFNGTPIDPLKFIFLRGGSTNTRFGESKFIDLQSAAWLYQKAQEFGLDALQTFGRPVPHARVPRNYDPGDLAELKAFLKDQFGKCIISIYDGQKVEIEMTSLAVASSGAAGRAELEWMRFYEGRMYIRLVRAQQTQDKTGGSRALEDSRIGLMNAAAVLYALLLCDGLQYGWMRPAMRINFPSLDPALYPRFIPRPNLDGDPAAVHAMIMNGIDRGIPYSLQDYFRRFGLQEATDPTDVLGHPVAKETSTIAEPPPATDPGADDADNGESDAAADPPDTEVTNGDPPAQPGSPSGERTPVQLARTGEGGGVMSLNGAQITSAVEVINKLGSGQISSIAATELLTAVGIARDRAEAVVASTFAVPPVDTTLNTIVKDAVGMGAPISQNWYLEKMGLQKASDQADVLGADASASPAEQSIVTGGE